MLPSRARRRQPLHSKEIPLRIEPDRTEATADQGSVGHLVREIVTTHVAAGDDRWDYPGLVALAFEAQSMRRSGTESDEWAADFDTRLRSTQERARASARRAADGTCPAWAVDLAPPEPHLEQSLERAKAQIPKRADRADEPGRMMIGGWDDERRAVLCAAGCLLGSAWPDMLAEVGVVVRQVALLEGFGIDGFTDFTAHGVVFVNSARLAESHEGVPPTVRLAEAVVHEAAHARCNAAAVSRPFLVAAGGDGDSLVTTPLRSDPRPLTGLFQQLVVLVRSAMLYARLLSAPAGDDAGALEARYRTLHGQGRQAVETLDRHAAKLTDHGRDVVADAGRLLHDHAAR